MAIAANLFDPVAQLALIAPAVGAVGQVVGFFLLCVAVSKLKRHALDPNGDSIQSVAATFGMFLVMISMPFWFEPAMGGVIGAGQELADKILSSAMGPIEQPLLASQAAGALGAGGISNPEGVETGGENTKYRVDPTEVGVRAKTPAEERSLMDFAALMEVLAGLGLLGAGGWTIAIRSARREQASRENTIQEALDKSARMGGK